MSDLRDIFGNEVKVGDKIAAGMSYGQSSVLRVGEIIAIKEKDDPYSRGRTDYSIRVRWTHNGSGSKYDVKESSILIKAVYSYAKILVLPKDYVEKFPMDNLKEGE